MINEHNEQRPGCRARPSAHGGFLPVARGRGRPFQKGNTVHGSRKGVPNKVPGSFKASVRKVCEELTGLEYDRFRFGAVDTANGRDLVVHVERRVL